MTLTFSVFEDLFSTVCLTREARAEGPGDVGTCLSVFSFLPVARLLPSHRFPGETSATPPENAVQTVFPELGNCNSVT